MEVEHGLTRMERDGPTRRSIEYRRWLARMDSMFVERILVVDRRIADLAGQIGGRAGLNGHNPGVSDCLIAATALEHNLTVLTRNTRHFIPLGAPCLDPFTELFE